jgi:hypothetical protein
MKFLLMAPGWFPREWRKGIVNDLFLRHGEYI